MTEDWPDIDWKFIEVLNEKSLPGRRQLTGGAPMEKEMIIVLDFGGQYNQLIARRVRECNVYAEVHPYTLSLEKIKEMTDNSSKAGIVFLDLNNLKKINDSYGHKVGDEYIISASKIIKNSFGRLV